MWDNFLSLFDSLPEDSIAITVYLLGGLIILSCWYGVVRRIVAPLGGILWIILFAIIATPTISEGPNSEIAPAAFGLLFGVLTKDSALVWANLSMILFVMGLGLLLGYLWSKYKTNQLKRAKTVSPL